MPFFHAPLQLPLHGIKPAGKASAGVFPRQLLFHQCFDVLTGSVRVTPRRRVSVHVRFTRSELVAAEPFGTCTNRGVLLSVRASSGSSCFCALFCVDTTAAGGHNSQDVGEEAGAGVKVISVGYLRQSGSRTRSQFSPALP